MTGSDKISYYMTPAQLRAVLKMAREQFKKEAWSLDALDYHAVKQFEKLVADQS